jgi:hypothetical protein
MPTARFLFGSSRVEHQIVTAGGYTTQVASTVEIFGPFREPRGRWSSAPVEPLSSHCGDGPTVRHTVYVMGGEPDVEALRLTR